MLYEVITVDRFGAGFQVVEPEEDDQPELLDEQVALRLDERGDEALGAEAVDGGADHGAMLGVDDGEVGGQLRIAVQQRGQLAFENRITSYNVCYTKLLRCSIITMVTSRGIAISSS